jgi:hypothetical protein
VEHPPNHRENQKGKTLNDQMETPIPGSSLHPFHRHRQPLNEENQRYPDVINQIRV